MLSIWPHSTFCHLIKIFLSQTILDSSTQWKVIADKKFKFDKMAENSQNGKKTLSEKEKLFITSIFSLSHSVFKPNVQQTHKNKNLFGKALNTVEFILDSN